MSQKGNIIDGKAISVEIQAKLEEEVKRLRAESGVVPGLAVVLVGERKDSQTYVRMKQKAAEQIGLYFVLKEVEETITQNQLLTLVKELNADVRIDGIIVQLPLPSHINEKEILDSIDIAKDIDGFHPRNIGDLAMKGRDPLFIPCTPKGCLELIKRTTSLEGKHVVVLGRSNIVGIPMSLLCLHENATVTICHSKTQNIKEITRQADVLVAAVGKPEMVRRDWVKPGAVVIDVGINPVEDPARKTGYKLVGDVAYEEVREVASAITPVPGGVGPMTVAMLLQNTVASAVRKRKRQKV